jgi:hypothetical protein
MEVILLVASIIGSLSAAASVFYLAKQIKYSRRTVKAQFISSLEHEFTVLFDTYTKLLPGEVWSSKEIGPKEPSELAKLIFYLGFFEKVAYLINLGALDFQTVDHLFAFRFFLITNNVHVQKNVLYSALFKDCWREIFDLHRKWSQFRLSRNQELLFEETSLTSLEEGETHSLNA